MPDDATILPTTVPILEALSASGSADGGSGALGAVLGGRGEDCKGGSKAREENHAPPHAACFTGGEEHDGRADWVETRASTDRSAQAQEISASAFGYKGRGIGDPTSVNSSQALFHGGVDRALVQKTDLRSRGENTFPLPPALPFCSIRTAISRYHASCK
jgi:hypothetical protein